MKTKNFQDAERQQTSVLAPLERAALRGLARRMPGWVNSDHLSILGLLGMILAGVFYALSKWNPLLKLKMLLLWLPKKWMKTLPLWATLPRVRLQLWVRLQMSRPIQKLILSLKFKLTRSFRGAEEKLR